MRASVSGELFCFYTCLRYKCFKSKWTTSYDGAELVCYYIINIWICSMRKVYYILVPCAFILTSSWFFSTQHLINTNKISSCHKSEISWSKYKGLWIISECWQRLGTMLSAFSSLYAREMDFSHKMFLHRSQANTLKYYFDIKTPLRIVDDIISRVQ